MKKSAKMLRCPHFQLFAHLYLVPAFFTVRMVCRLENIKPTDLQSILVIRYVLVLIALRSLKSLKHTVYRSESYTGTNPGREGIKHEKYSSQKKFTG
jgi:hypothetical protein